jgi:formin-binding protein 1
LSGINANFLQVELNVEGGAKVFLQNKLSRSRGKLHELKPLLEAKSK